MTSKIECLNLVDVEAVLVEITLPKPDSAPASAIIPPSTSPTHPIVCRLGLDKKSGRVKWCPDCQFIKYLLIVPVILLPITVIFVLMMRISNMYNGRIEILPTTERIKMSSDLEPYHRLTRDVNEIIATINHNCEIHRHLAAESIDIHDKELFRDIRTSFIPSEMCLRHRYRNHSTEMESVDQNVNSVDDLDQANQSKSVDQLRRWINKYADPVDYNRLNLEWQNTMNFRRRRRQIDDFMEKMTNQTNQNESESIAENIAKKINEFVDDKPLEIPAFLRTFWKGGKTYEQIRKSQVEIMKQYMDLSVAPCNDFYQYACGNWEKLNPIPKDKGAYDTFEMLREILDIELNSLLSESKKAATNVINSSDDLNSTEISPTDAVDTPNSIEVNMFERSKNAQKSDEFPRNVNAEQKAKYLYKSCMNTEILQKRKLEPLYRLLDSLGGWPVIDADKWDASKFDWLELTAKLRLYNNDVFIMQWVGPDIKNSNENVIQFDQNSLGLPTRDYFIRSTNAFYLEAYREFAQQVIFLCGVNERTSTNAADEIVKFEIELAKIMASSQDRMNVTQLYRRMTVAALYDYVPEIDWQRYLEIVLEQNIERNEVVVMFALNFMQDLVQLINNTDKRTVANYMLWKFVRHRINSLDDRFYEAKQKFYNILIGRKKSPPRWKTCVNQVNSNMGMAVGAMFVREYFDDSSKQDTLAMTHELQQTFREILNETHWLDDETKVLAESKVNRMSLKIGYPDYILNIDELNQKYADLDIHPDRYFENVLNVLRYLTRIEQNRLRERVNRTAWNTAPAVVNAYYSRNKNQIIFPAAILQPPFYHRHLPRSFNFGGIGKLMFVDQWVLINAIYFHCFLLCFVLFRFVVSITGVVIGHELTHGFDDKGRLFDHDGNLNRWWSEPAIEIFHQRASCLISQYGSYRMSEIGGVAVDGIITQGENIADNGGIKQGMLMA